MNKLSTAAACLCAATLTTAARAQGSVALRIQTAHREGVHQHVSGAHVIAVCGKASVSNLAASSNDRQAVVGASIRHRF
jgi:general bacterial porin, GBP family